MVILILRVDTLSCFESLNRIDSINYGKLGHYNVIVGLIFSVVTGSGKIMHGHIFVHAPLIHQALGEKVATNNFFQMVASFYKDLHLQVNW